MKKLILIFLFLTAFLNAQQVAFPTAYGDGAFVTGGRGGIVVHVTNLNDSGAGSLREALSMTVPRTIVFDVSGIIKLEKLLFAGENNGNFTLAGQTAPKGGITIIGGRFYLENTDNIIIRHIRFKGGVDADTNPSKDDNLGNDSVSAVNTITSQIWDHCSFAFGVDECASWYATKDGNEVNELTIQKCLFAENVKGSIIGKESGKSGKAATVSFLNNLFYNSGYRSPNVAGDNARIDILNNVVWNSKARLIRGNGSFSLNEIGNYYHYHKTYLKNTALNVFAFSTIPQIFTKENIIVAPSFSSNKDDLTNSVEEMNINNQLSWKFFLDGGGYEYGDQLPSKYFTNKQHTLLGRKINLLTAKETLLQVPNDVGCNARLNADGSISDNKDVDDTKWLKNVINGTFTDKLDISEYKVAPITSVVRDKNFYVSNPHIPEAWFSVNVPKGKDHNDISDNGFTYLEEYLNLVDGDYVIDDTEPNDEDEEDEEIEDEEVETPIETKIKRIKIITHGR